MATGIFSPLRTGRASASVNRYVGASRVVQSATDASPPLPCSQFAYNEISFMLVRLLQRFSSIKLRQDAHPESVAPPGVERSPYAVDGCERVWMRSHLTAYAKVSLGLYCFWRR